jgi:hypothetical protein
MVFEYSIGDARFTRSYRGDASGAANLQRVLPTAMTAKFTCSDCRWWHVPPPQEGDDRSLDRAVGYCRRFPPTRRDNGIGAWPITFNNDWCGEYLERAGLTH